MSLVVVVRVIGLSWFKWNPIGEVSIWPASPATGAKGVVVRAAPRSAAVPTLGRCLPSVHMSEPKVQKSEQEWREELSPERYNVLREAGTEPPFSGEYTYSKDDGMFRCGACGAELFSSDSKFDSGTGWPSFTEPAVADAVELKKDQQPLHGPHRGAVRELRLAPRATCSTTAPARRASATASTPCRWT